MSDAERWLDALGEQLAQAQDIVPALAAVKEKLQRVDEHVVAEVQSDVAKWHAALTRAARAVLGARLSRAAPARPVGPPCGAAWT